MYKRQPIECLLVPKALFKDERYCSLSTTAKVLYSLMLDRLKYAAQNRWVDQKGKLYVIYPKSEMIRDLNSTRYRVDYAVSELESMGNMVRVVKDNGRPNRFYINDISKNEEENVMMTINDLMEMVTPEAVSYTHLQIKNLIMNRLYAQLLILVVQLSLIHI